MTYRAPMMTLNIAEQYLGVTCYYEVYINWDTYVVDTGLSGLSRLSPKPDQEIKVHWN